MHVQRHRVVDQIKNSVTHDPGHLVKGNLRSLRFDNPNLLPLGHCESRSGPRSSGRLPLLASLISLALLLAPERGLSVLAKRRGRPSRLGGDICALGSAPGDLGAAFGAVVLGPGRLGPAGLGRQRLLLAARPLGRFGGGVLRVSQRGAMCRSATRRGARRHRKVSLSDGVTSVDSRSHLQHQFPPLEEVILPVGERRRSMPWRQKVQEAESALL